LGNRSEVNIAKPDTSELKERERSNWSSAAEGWRRRDALLRKGAAPVTRRMLELCGISSGSRLPEPQACLAAAQKALKQGGRITYTGLLGGP